MNPRVLIVEDEAAIRLALSGLLRREGYDVEQADAGDAAIARLRAAGHEAAPRREYWGAARTQVHTPAGHRVEVMAAPPAVSRA